MASISFPDAYKKVQVEETRSCCKKEKGMCHHSDSAPCCDCCYTTSGLLITYAIVPSTSPLVEQQTISTNVIFNTTYLNHYHFDYSSNLFHPPKAV